MTIVTETITIKAPVEKVFAAYVERVDEWWPRRGAQYRYSFAPKDVEPDQIRFEARAGGRLYETFANGEEYLIGTIQDYSPPQKIAYTWKDPDWNAETLIEVSFAQSGEETILNLRHTGFEKLEQSGLAAGYQEGSTEIFGILKTWLEQNIVED